MKRILFYTFICIILPALIFSCDEKNGIGIPEDNGNDTLETKPEPIKDYWDANNFQPLNDEFNEFRNFQAGLIYPYDLSNPRVQNYFQTSEKIDCITVMRKERIANSYAWIEVLYPENDPSKVEYSVYKIERCYYRFDSFLKDYYIGSTEFPDSAIMISHILKKDGDTIARIDRYPHGKCYINMNNERKLLYDFKRVLLASKGVLFSNDSLNVTEIYGYPELNEEIINSDKCFDANCFAEDQYGGKVLGSFGSLTSFLLPINGPSPEGMVQEVVGLRDGVVSRVGPGWHIFNSVRFIYKNTQSQAAPYLPDWVWDIHYDEKWNNLD